MRSEGYVKVYEDKPEVKKASSKSEKTPEVIEKEVAAILARAKAPGDYSHTHKYTNTYTYIQPSISFSKMSHSVVSYQQPSSP